MDIQIAYIFLRYIHKYHSKHRSIQSLNIIIHLKGNSTWAIIWVKYSKRRWSPCSYMTVTVQGRLPGILNENSQTWNPRELHPYESVKQRPTFICILLCLISRVKFFITKILIKNCLSTFRYCTYILGYYQIRVNSFNLSDVVDYCQWHLLTKSAT